MVKSHLEKRITLVKSLELKGITDKAVLQAMIRVPRHAFMDINASEDPYEDIAQPIGSGQTISQPFIVALMSQYLELTKDKVVLEIGTGSGYQTAILCELAKHVYTIERIPALSKKAVNILKKQGYDNFTPLISDGSLGDKTHAPYDAIIVTASPPDIPEELVQQLKTTGKMVIPVGNRMYQNLLCITKSEDGYETETITSVSFVPMIGEKAWQFTS